MRRLLVALLTLAVVAGTGVVAAQSTATVGVDAPSSVTAGQSVSAALVVTDVADPEGVGSFTVNVTYDPSVVTVTASGTSTFDVSTSHPEPGVLTIVGYTGQYPGPNGTVTLAGLSVTGKSAGSSSLDTTVESITDADGNALTVAVTADSITVKQSSSGSSGSDEDSSSSSEPSGSSTSGSTGSQPGETDERGTPNLQVVDATLSARAVAPGEPVMVTATIENSGNASGTADLALVIDGRATGNSRLVEVPAGETRTVSIETRLESVGEYSVSFGGATAGTLSVVESDTPTATETQPVTPTPTATPTPPDPVDETPTATDTGTPTAGSGPGFGLLAGLVALIVVALRQRR